MPVPLDARGDGVQLPARCADAMNCSPQSLFVQRQQQRRAHACPLQVWGPWAPGCWRRASAFQKGSQKGAQKGSQKGEADGEGCPFADAGTQGRGAHCCHSVEAVARRLHGWQRVPRVPSAMPMAAAAAQVCIADANKCASGRAGPPADPGKRERNAQVADRWLGSGRSTGGSPGAPRSAQGNSGRVRVLEGRLREACPGPRRAMPTKKARTHAHAHAHGAKVPSAMRAEVPAARLCAAYAELPRPLARSRASSSRCRSAIRSIRVPLHWRPARAVPAAGYALCAMRAGLPSAACHILALCAHRVAGWRCLWNIQDNRMAGPTAHAFGSFRGSTGQN